MKAYRGIATVAAVFAASSQVRADIPPGGHNGSLISDPIGTGDVNVDLYDLAPNTVGAFQIAKFFNEIAEHQLGYEYLPGEPHLAAIEQIYNVSGDPWSKFTIVIDDADFYVAGSGEAPSIVASNVDLISVGHVLFTSLDASYTSMPQAFVTRPGGEFVLLEILFSDPFPHGGPLDGIGFQLEFDVDYDQATLDEILNNPDFEPPGGFLMLETPTPAVIPAPGAALLAAVGLGLLRYCRRVR